MTSDRTILAKYMMDLTKSRSRIKAPHQTGNDPDFFFVFKI